MKKSKRSLSLILAMIMCVALAIPALAVEPQVLPTLPDGSIILGTKENDEGTPAYFADGEVHTRASSTLPFTLTANAVYDLLTTGASGSKYITASMLTTGVAISGTLTYSPKPSTSNPYATGGLCTYDSRTGNYIASSVGSDDFYSGRNHAFTVGKGSLSQNETYYGFVKNLFGGSIKLSGSLTYSNAYAR